MADLTLRPSILAYVRVTVFPFLFGCALWAVPSAQAELRHRYTFDHNTPALGTFEDTVGNADGTLFGDATISNGSLILPGGGMGKTGDHARLFANGADGININSYTNATFALWATVTTNTRWSRYFDIGGHSIRFPNDAGNTISAITDANGPTGWRFAISNVDLATQIGALNEQQLNTTMSPTENVRHHLVITFDGTNDIGRLFVNGTQLAQATNFTHQLALLQSDFAILGGSLYSIDPSFNGSIDQFDIFDTALTPQEVLNLYLVPEPGAFALLVSGVVLVGITRRQRR